MDERREPRWGVIDDRGHWIEGTLTEDRFEIVYPSGFNGLPVVYFTYPPGEKESNDAQD